MKYKIIHDYPYLISKYNDKINKKNFKCIYRKLRTDNYKQLESKIVRYNKSCNEINKNKEFTEQDTEEI
jgi:hypothetical protein